MSRTDALHPSAPEFERFLYASVGLDRNGNIVTVLSTLARLGLDPWKESVGLAMLGRYAAGARLASLLSRFQDVPELVRDHGSVAERLALLLPERPPPRAVAQAGSSATEGQRPSTWRILVILMILLAVAQILF